MVLMTFRGSNGGRLGFLAPTSVKGPPIWGQIWGLIKHDRWDCASHTSQAEVAPAWKVSCLLKGGGWSPVGFQINLRPGSYNTKGFETLDTNQDKYKSGVRSPLIYNPPGTGEKRKEKILPDSTRVPRDRGLRQERDQDPPTYIFWKKFSKLLPCWAITLSSLGTAGRPWLASCFL